MGDMTRTGPLTVALAALGSALLAAPHHSATIALRNKIPLAAEPFELRDVRLLDGPFRDAMVRDEQYLLELDPDRLLHTFRLTAGLPTAAQPLGGWEAPDVELRGHSLGHYLSALAILNGTTGDARFKQRADALVSALAPIQEALAKRFTPGYLSAFPEEFFDRVDAGKRVWAPYYTIHKIMAGLLDVHLLCGNRQALDILKKKADWVKTRVDRLSDEQQQIALRTEFGGMNEVLANLYAVTGDPDHLRVAKKFDHHAVFDPLARGEDPLDGLHANTQIPKAIGAAREYEVTGDTRYRDIAAFFWTRVALGRSYANGGHSDGERFFPIDQFDRHLGASSAETCNTYNMLKLTRHLFAWSPSAETMDFYERGLYNHILASQDPKTGGVLYYCPLRPGAFKTFSTPTESFWCCVGTGMENHGKYNDTIYFHDARSLYVNLYIPSELTWKDQGLVVRQDTRFPEEDTTRLTFATGRGAPIALKVRYPSWARPGMSLTINGQRQAVSATPGSYVTIEREWTTGDVVVVRLPMSLRYETLPGEPKTIALLYGPILLAGDLGTEGLESVRRYGPSAPPLGRVRPVAVPSFVADDVGRVLEKVTPAQTPLTFQTAGLGQPRDVTLRPFYTVFEPRYTVYWNVYTPAEWVARRSEVAAAEARRKEIAARTIDAVDPGNEQSERDHGFQGENATEAVFEGRRGRDARNGWISYTVKVAPDRPTTLVCTYRGSEGRRRSFDILVDGQKIAGETLEYHPTEFLDKEYPIPEELTRGKDRVTVRLQSHPEATAGSLFDLRVVAR
jgi:hypothetical protein